MGFSFFDTPDPLVWWHVLLVAIAIAVASFVIGVFGVAGGVVYVPALLMLPGVVAKNKQLSISRYRKQANILILHVFRYEGESYDNDGNNDEVVAFL